jgi:hypothetical protein
MKQYIFIATLLIVCSTTANASNEITSPVPIAVHSVKPQNTFTMFRTHRQGRRAITATWEFSSSSTVTGFIVERTYEDPTDPYAYWETVGSAAFTGVKTYKITETNVFPGFLTYRIIAVLANGSTVVSAISTEHIVSH